MRKLVLWGHGIDEYREMFALSTDDLNGNILEYGCGPSAVNSTQHALNHKVISCDPLFVLDKDTLYSKAVMIFASMAEEINEDQAQFDFTRSGGLPQLIAQRKQGMQHFFADYEEGKKDGRYIGVTDYHL
ncbi:MAG: hypothetical protein PSV35_01050, partial [bacterium]|nr:hypothetical protein [bacterium]